MIYYSLSIIEKTNMDHKQFVLNECVDMKMLNYIYRNLDFLLENNRLGKFKSHKFGYQEIKDKNIKKTLLTNLFNTKSKNLEVKYSYPKWSNDKIWGRKFADSVSLQNLPKKVRNILARDIYYDLDIENCAPTILKSYIIESQIVDSCKTIIQVIDNREKYLTILTKKYNISRDKSKKTLLSIINGGLGHHEFPYEQWLTKFYNEMKVVMNYFVNSDLGKPYYELAKKKKTYNILGSAMNLLYCQKEDILLSSVCKNLVHKKFSIGTYIFDGCLVYRDQHNPLTDNILKEIESLVFKDTGMNITLKIKEMEDVVDLSGIDKEDYSVRFEEEDIARFIFFKIKKSILFDETTRVVYYFNHTKSKWCNTSLENIDSFLDDLPDQYCKEKGIEMTLNIIYRLKSNSWKKSVFDIVKKLISLEEDSIIIRYKKTEKPEDFI